MATGKTRLLICGGGNAAHAWSGIASSQPNTDVRVLIVFSNKAERWSNLLRENDFIVNLCRQGNVYSKLNSKPTLVTNNAEKAVPGCDVVAFASQAFAHEQYLEAIKPHITPGTILIGLPGRAGFEFQVRDILGDVAKQLTIMNFESLPWATRTTKFGQSCNVLGIKDTLFGAMQIGSSLPNRDPLAVLQSLLGEKPVVQTGKSLLSGTLMSDCFMHPCVMYDRWSMWDGKPLNECPLYYKGLSEKGADLICKVSDEVLSIARAITKQDPSVDVSHIEHIHHWFLRCYPDEIEDKSTVYSSITTNKAYQTMTHPMVAVEGGKFLPDFNYRYLKEDVPYGLVVIRGIAEVMGVKTPNMDEVLTWAQQHINKKYLVGGKIQGEDVNSTRAPQRFGFKTLVDLIGK